MEERGINVSARPLQGNSQDRFSGKRVQVRESQQQPSRVSAALVQEVALCCFLKGKRLRAAALQAPLKC